jgi:hypothetical protein
MFAPLALLAVLALPSAGATLSQSVAFPSIQPFGVFTTGDVLAANWSAPFPVLMPSDIEEIRITFTSSDDLWLSGSGPNGGVPSVEIGFLDQAMNRAAIASVNKDSGTIFLGNAQNPLTDLLRQVLADGAFTASLGGFESFPQFSNAYTFGPLSNLRIEIDYRQQNGGGTPGGEVPEPSTWVLIGSGLLAAAFARRRFGM